MFVWLLNSFTIKLFNNKVWALLSLFSRIFAPSSCNYDVGSVRNCTGNHQDIQYFVGGVIFDVIAVTSGCWSPLEVGKRCFYCWWCSWWCDDIFICIGLYLLQNNLLCCFNSGSNLYYMDLKVGESHILGSLIFVKQQWFH